MPSSISINADDASGSFDAYVAHPESGSGPALVVIQEIFGVNSHIREVCDYWAQEGYVAVAPDLFWRMKPNVQLGYSDDDFKVAFDYFGRLDYDKCVDDISAAVHAARALPEVSKQNGAKNVAVIGFCLGGKLAWLTAAHPKAKPDAAVSYYGVNINESLSLKNKISCPVLLHFAEKDGFVPMDAVAEIQKTLADKPNQFQIHTYPDVDHGFNCNDRPAYHKPSANLAASRTVELLRKTCGPHYNLVQLWENHCAMEFEQRDADAAMKTMVDEPYVNHIPTLTGGVGFNHLRHFYQNHFVNSLPADTTLSPVSRTVGADRLVDEMIFSFTHSTEIDWMLPGVAPTNKKVEIPLVALVQFRGPKIHHEHIYWDQASVLTQIGLLDPKNLPVAGVETARKVLDETLPSNALMADKWSPPW